MHACLRVRRAGVWSACTRRDAAARGERRGLGGCLLGSGLGEPRVLRSDAGWALRCGVRGVTAAELSLSGGKLQNRKRIRDLPDKQLH